MWHLWNIYQSANQERYPSVKTTVSLDGSTDSEQDSHRAEFLFNIVSLMLSRNSKINFEELVVDALFWGMPYWVWHLLNNTKIYDFLSAPCHDRRCHPLFAVCGRNLSGAEEAGWKFFHVSWIFEHTLCPCQMFDCLHWTRNFNLATWGMKAAAFRPADWNKVFSLLSGIFIWP